jgi:LPS sulfotransferase NodH
MGATTKFVILSAARSGSCYLNGFLRSHGNILCRAEIFHPNYKGPNCGVHFYNYYVRSSLKNRIIHSLSPWQSLKFFMKESFKKDTHKASGFKLLYFQAEHNQLIFKYLKQNDFRIIHLLRKNILRRYLSLEIAKKNNIWVQFDGDTVKKSKIKVECSKIIEELNKTKEEQAYYSKQAKDFVFLKCEYENLCRDTKKELQKIQDFLKVPKRDLKPQSVKQNSFSINEIANNYEELKSTLKNTEYVVYLQ